jgi:hypothetical protein
MSIAFMRRIHASAIGEGMVSAILAATEKPQSETIETWVQFCLKAGDEAHTAVLENPPTITIKGTGDPGMLTLLRIGDQLSREDNARYGGAITTSAREYESGRAVVTRPMDGTELEAYALAAASMAFRCCMPQLTGRRRAQAYFACVAAGLQRGYFKGAEAKAMLHSAQLALNAYPKRQQKPRPARQIGYKSA